MSTQDIHKKKRIIQKLDFENCVITSIKTTARGRKKLRARISREIADVSEGAQLQEGSPSVSPVLTQGIHSEEPTSPVLIKNQCRNSVSPVFFKRKKLESPEKEDDNTSENLTIEEISSSPGSPVFKTFKRHKLENTPSNSKSFSEKATVVESFDSQENSSLDRQDSFLIEDFTQESKQSVKISSVDSTEVKSHNISSYSVEENAFGQDAPEELSSSPERPVRRHYKKNSLMKRLHTLQRKQASEKLLWQHQNRKMSANSVKVVTVGFWKEEFHYFIKCQTMLSDFEEAVVIVDSRWVPNVKKIKENSVLLLHPPWQRLTLEESMFTVLVNVICMDVLDETAEPTKRKRTLETVPTNLFKTDKKLFVESLFISCRSGYLC